MLSPKRVQILTPSVAEKIAAGEVVERPASVVKELIENALDAGATEIQVLLENGGKSLIEVTDNGSGMSPEDLELSIERHATSKISSLSDLENICSLGFRGEALPSIRAVAETSIITRVADAHSAFELPADLKKSNPITFGRFIDSPHGTRIQAQGLFSQVPARLKFLKSQGAEVSQVRDWIERLALAYPKTGFRLISDDRMILNLRPQDEVERVKTILAEGDNYPVISASNELAFRGEDYPGKLSIRAHWVQGLSLPHTRKLFQVVNSRIVKDRLIQHAMLSAFRQSLLPGQFPALSLWIEVDPALLDVNVHPAKTEIRFIHSRKIYSAVENLLSSMISERGAPAYVPTSSQFRSEFLRGSSHPYEARDSGWNFNATPSPTAEPSTLGLPETSRFGRYVGLMHNTYIIYESMEEMVLIDQHAAHERVRFEALKKSRKSGTGMNPQSLLLPEAIHIEKEQRKAFEDRISRLTALGFETEIFGEESVVFRSVPAAWGVFDLKSRLKNLVERTLALEIDEITSAPSLDLDDRLFEKLASESCHSAIRAGDRMDATESETLVRDLFTCEHPWNCPHGRPTVVRIPRGKIEEWFQRRAPLS